MGLYDREYYRDEEPGWGDWLTGRAVVGLIALTAGLYFLQLLARNPGGPGDAVSQVFGLNPAAVLNGEVWRPFTASFLHDPTNLARIVLNMLVLYFFGIAVEPVRGSKEFIAFYFVAGAVGQWADVLVRSAVRYDPTVFHNLDRPPLMFGADGAVEATVVLMLLLHPGTQLPLVQLPLWPFVAVLLGLDLLSLVVGRPVVFQTNPAMNLAAAGFALAYHRLGWRLTGWSLGFGSRMQRPGRGRPALRVVPEDDEPEPVAAPAPRRNARAVDEQLEAKLDFVLEKVARSGKESLTADENEILLRASEIYKRRREREGR